MKTDKRSTREVSGVFAKLFLACIICGMMVAVLTGLSNVSNQVTIEKDGETYTKYTMYTELDDILEQEGIELGPNDTCKFTGFKDHHAKLTINTSFDVNVTADGVTQTLTMSSGNVSDVLKLLGITLSETDEVNADLDAPLRENNDIQVTRVVYEESQETRVVPHKTIQPPTAPAADETIAVETPGADGEKLTTLRKKLVDGKEVENIVVAEQVTKAPVAEVLKVEKVPQKVEEPAVQADAASSEAVQEEPAPVSGTTEYYVGGQKVYCAPGEAPVELDENGDPISYQYTVTGKATAYSALGKPTQLVPGCVAMDLSKYPKGTMLYIKSVDGSYTYGYSKVADTGEFVYTTDVLVDCFFNTYEESCQFGAKQVIIYVL